MNDGTQFPGILPCQDRPGHPYFSPKNVKNRFFFTFLGEKCGIKMGNHRIIANQVGKEVPPYLEALGLDEKVFTTPGGKCKPMLKQ